LPNEKGLTPNYGDMMFEKSERENQLLHIVSNHGKAGKIHINQEADIFVGVFDADKEIEVELDGHDYIYLVLIEGEITVNDILVEQQDSIESSEDLIIKMIKQSHLLVLKVNEHK